MKQARGMNAAANLDLSGAGERAARISWCFGTGIGGLGGRIYITCASILRDIATILRATVEVILHRLLWAT